MPYINAKVNKSFSESQAQNFKSEMGKAIETFPGKSENWLMVSLEEGKVWFKGTSDPAAIVEVSVYGSVNHNTCNKMTNLISQSINKNFSIPEDRIYVKYSPIDEWGWNGSNF